jgi:hypothetical protein
MRWLKNAALVIKNFGLTSSLIILVGNVAYANGFAVKITSKMVCVLFVGRSLGRNRFTNTNRAVFPAMR